MLIGQLPTSAAVDLSHVDSAVRAQVLERLSASGLSEQVFVSHFYRLFAQGQFSLLDLLGPNTKTLAAMQELEDGGGVASNSTDELFADLHATIEHSTQFKKDYKKAAKSTDPSELDSRLKYILNHLVSDRKLPGRFRDHQLKENWRDHRDCHVFPDLVLIYQLKGGSILRLVRPGSHSELCR